jgi:phosphoribosylamine--glycine ligase
VFGPSAAAARIEGSKSFAKEVLRAAGVPAAPNLAIAQPPCVVKADGLAAGKGVFVCRSQSELDAALHAVRALGPSFVVEELLEGSEVSVLALCDGRNAIPLPAARDFKRAFDGDEGPNTGGMGSYSPVPEVDHEQLVEQIHAPVLTELARRGASFVGVLYAGVMLTDDGPRVLEFNCRFGDPEAQSILPRIEGDLLGAFAAAAAGDASGVSLATDPGAAVTVVVAAGDYPAHGDSGSAIHGIPDAEASGALVFHAGTAQRDERIVTNGGRILDVTGIGATIAEARDRAYTAAEEITFDGARFRRDIAAEAALV